MAKANFKISGVVYHNNNVTFTAKDGNKVIEATIDISTFEDDERLLLFLIPLIPDKTERPDKHRDVKGDYHLETIFDDVLERDIEVVVIDTVNGV